MRRPYSDSLRAGRSGDQIPVWGEIFRSRPDLPWGPPSLLYNGYRVSTGGKGARAWSWPRTPSSAEVKERVEVYLYSPSGPSWPVPGWTLPSLPLPSMRSACWITKATDTHSEYVTLLFLCSGGYANALLC